MEKDEYKNGLYAIQFSLSHLIPTDEDEEDKEKDEDENDNTKDEENKDMDWV